MNNPVGLGIKNTREERRGEGLELSKLWSKRTG
jgi:hypothetical protein